MYVVDKQLTLSGLQTSYHVCVFSTKKQAVGEECLCLDMQGLVMLSYT